MEKKRLGRGLDALLATEWNENETTTSEIPVALLDHNPNQPRKHFDADEITQLSESVKAHGILQPIVVRHLGERYQIVAGERRLRAAQEAGLESVPIRVVNFNDQEALEAALVENIQRSDLNPIEKALGFKDYLDRFNLNQEQLAKRLGLARSTVSNLVNLLELAPEVQDGIRLGQISEAHAKLLKGVRNKERQIALYKQIVAMGLSVKATEGLIRERKEDDGEQTSENGEIAPAAEKSAHVKGIEDELRQKLATPIEIKLRGKDRGQIVLRFESNDDFERLLEVLRR